MTYLEFDEVMKAIGINNHLSKNDTKEKVYYWNNLAIWFGGSYYTIVNGKIPLEVANIIYEKYPGNPYNIRVNGGYADWNPTGWAVDEKYIETYHIDSKEGLLIFLTEIEDYLLRKNNLPETEVEKYDELIAKITSEILEKVNPSISAYDWMQGDKENKNNYNSSVERDNNNSGQIFRDAVLDFDKAVNPFLNNDIELDEISNYLKNVIIDADTYDSINGKNRQGCCSLEITDISTGNKTTYYRDPDGFSFELSYKLGEENYLQVSHYFSTSDNYESGEGEVVEIYYQKDNVKNGIVVILNITNGKAGCNYDVKSSITSVQIAFVYGVLLKAIKLASSITVKNMKKINTPKRIMHY